jgi:hypothetical protein
MKNLVIQESQSMKNLVIQVSKSMSEEIINHIKKYKGMLEYPPRFYYTGITQKGKGFSYNKIK